METTSVSSLTMGTSSSLSKLDLGDWIHFTARTTTVRPRTMQKREMMAMRPGFAAKSPLIRMDEEASFKTHKEKYYFFSYKLEEFLDCFI